MYIFKNDIFSTIKSHLPFNTTVRQTILPSADRCMRPLSFIHAILSFSLAAAPPCVSATEQLPQTEHSPLVPSSKTHTSYNSIDVHTVLVRNVIYICIMHTLTRLNGVN